jgi:hypothetical protein
MSCTSPRSGKGGGIHAAGEGPHSARIFMRATTIAAVSDSECFSRWHRPPGLWFRPSYRRRPSATKVSVQPPAALHARSKFVGSRPCMNDAASRGNPPRQSPLGGHAVNRSGAGSHISAFATLSVLSSISISGREKTFWPNVRNITSNCPLRSRAVIQNCGRGAGNFT